jgi:hypothetical protein
MCGFMKYNIIIFFALFAILCSCRKQIDYDQLRTKNSDTYESIEFIDNPIGFQRYANTEPEFSISVPKNYVMSVLVNTKEARVFQFTKEFQVIKISIIDMYSLTHAISVGRGKFSYNDYIASDMKNAFNEYIRNISEGKGGNALDIQEKAIKKLGKNTLIYIRYNQFDKANEYTHVQYNFLNEGYAITIVGVFSSNEKRYFEVIQSMNSFSYK